MLKIKEAIIVEGNYDKIKLSSCVDALILTTDGFGVFKNREKLELIRTLAEQIGVILLTDADRAGFTIRNYIPDIKGKEKRKDAPSKEGLLGVEGMEKELLIDALLKAGATVEGEEASGAPSGAEGRLLTKLDLYQDGFAGGADSAQKRRALLRALHLPQRLSANMMIDVVNTALGYDAYRKAASKIREKEK